MERMGATATHELERETARDTSPPRAKSLGLTLMRPIGRARRVSFFNPVPQEVLLLDEGIAVATYADDGAVQYANLDALLEDHGLEVTDLEVVQRVQGLGRWQR
jgi:hypothetical protein